MMRLKLIMLLICAFSVSVFADTEGSTLPKQPNSQNTIVSLSRRNDNKIARTPSLNPQNQIDGIYNEDGILFLYPSIDSEWELVISSKTASVTLQTSTEELISGIYIGKLSNFTIALSSSTGAIFVGTVYLD